MRSFSPRHRARQGNKRKALRLADEIKEAALAGRSVSSLSTQLNRVVQDSIPDTSVFPCFKCGATIDEDTDTYGILHVSAFSVEPAEFGSEPTRFKGIDAPIVPICQTCVEAFNALLDEQKVD